MAKPFMKKKKKDKKEDFVLHPRKIMPVEFFDDGYDRDGYNTQTPGTSLPATFIPASDGHQGTTSSSRIKRIAYLRVRILYASIQGLIKEFSSLRKKISDIKSKIENMIKDNASSVDEACIKELQSIWEKILSESNDLENDPKFNSENLDFTKAWIEFGLGASIKVLSTEMKKYNRLIVGIGAGPDRQRLSEALQLIHEINKTLNSIQRYI